MLILEVSLKCLVTVYFTSPPPKYLNWYNTERNVLRIVSVYCICVSVYVYSKLGIGPQGDFANVQNHFLLGVSVSPAS